MTNPDIDAIVREIDKARPCGCAVSCHYGFDREEDCDLHRLMLDKLWPAISRFHSGSCYPVASDYEADDVFKAIGDLIRSERAALTAKLEAAERERDKLKSELEKAHGDMDATMEGWNALCASTDKIEAERDAALAAVKAGVEALKSARRWPYASAKAGNPAAADEVTRIDAALAMLKVALND